MNKIIPSIALRLLTLCILIPTLAVWQILDSVSAATFSDVNPDTTFANHIYSLAELEIINGFSDGSFRPDNFVTRGELTKFVVNAFNIEVSDELESEFTDVDEENKFFAEIITLSNLEIINGYPNNTFKPNNPVTRGEAMKIIVNSVKIIYEDRFDESTKLQLFSDVDSANTFITYINSAASIKLEDDSRIINGYSDKRFGIDDFVTRGALSKIIDKSIFYTNDGGDFDPPMPYASTSDSPTKVDIDDDDLDVYAIFSIEGDEISAIEINNEPNSNEYNLIWERLVDIIPAERRTALGKFAIVSDGEDEMAAAVQRDNDNIEKWIIMVDIIDFYDGDEIDITLLDYVLIHEMAHVISLNADEVNITDELYSANLSQDEYDELVVESREECSPNYYAQDACSLDGSYLQNFFEIFWDENYQEWENIQEDSDEDSFDVRMLNFYKRHKNEFVNEYASTSPEEDIAESFAFFILDSKPSENSTKVSDQKILFFYDFPELVELRESIRSNTE